MSAPNNAELIEILFDQIEELEDAFEKEHAKNERLKTQRSLGGCEVCKDGVGLCDKHAWQLRNQIVDLLEKEETWEADKLEAENLRAELRMVELDRQKLKESLRSKQHECTCETPGIVEPGCAVCLLNIFQVKLQECALKIGEISQKEQDLAVDNLNLQDKAERYGKALLGLSKIAGIGIDVTPYCPVCGCAECLPNCAKAEAEREDNWLEKSLDDARREVDTWSESQKAAFGVGENEREEP